MKKWLPETEATFLQFALQIRKLYRKSARESWKKQSVNHTGRSKGKVNRTITLAKNKNKFKNASGFTLIEIMIVVLIIGTLLAIAFPNLANARETSRRRTCIGNLRRIQWAKDSYLMENNLPMSHTPTAADLYGPNSFLKYTPECNGGGGYTINSGWDDPTCDYQGGGVHVMLDD
jgi:prepilin-type N-terminal cleavage/methylation domain-containing protein